MASRLYRRILNMSFINIAGIISLIVLVAAIAVRSLIADTVHQCRVIPGDALWPAESDWSSLNDTLDGRLISTVPIAAPCHTTLFGKSNAAFDQAKCDALRNVWFSPETHLPSSSSPMAFPFGNNSCNPFTAPNMPCDIGYHIRYAVNASSAADFQEAIAFVRKHNIRLVIRNTGHDYLGKSTGAHSLSIWTHYMKDISLIKHYQNSKYSGPAIQLGAGVEVHEAYTFADAHGLVVVGGNCPTVGIAGGYTQGGGHGPLVSKFGLAADQVLEWEVVTSSGDLLKATPRENPDLFWALSGGGGSTYGIVVSMTVKAHPDTYVSIAHLTLLNNGTNADSLFGVIRTFLLGLSDLVDNGVMATWVAAPFGFMLMPAFGPELHKQELDELLQPTLNKMKELNMDYQYSSVEYPTFLSGFNSLPNSWNVSDHNLGGRLIPRSLIEEDVGSLVDVIRNISERALVIGVSYNVRNGVLNPDDVAVNPYLRKSLFSIALGTPINYSDWLANKAAQDQITNDFLPQLERLTTNGGAYGNEGDFQAPDFKTLFYGEHYDRLDRIKALYDPLDIFYATTAVGSDRWTQDLDGRLCRTLSEWYEL